VPDGTGLAARGVGFRSLQEAIDTTAGGQLVFHVFAALAEVESDGQGATRDAAVWWRTAEPCSARIYRTPTQ
jgi:hypothetical protein